MTLKTPRQRRVMRKAIKMARAGQRDQAYTRYLRATSEIKGDIRGTRPFKVALARARRARDLVATIEDVRLIPPEVMMLRALKRAGRRLNARHT